MVLIQKSSCTLSKRLSYRFFVTGFAGMFALACAPATETIVDGGDEVVDSGNTTIDSGTPVVDAGQPPLPHSDAGGSDDCPAFSPVVGAPVGESCGTEGLRCGPESCLAPGPGACAFVVCRDGTWQFENIARANDAGTPSDPTDAGNNAEADAGQSVDVDAGDASDTDAGNNADADAGQSVDVDAGDAGDTDAGDVSGTDAGNNADAG